MLEIARVTTKWTGLAGGIGYTNLYYRDFETVGIDQAIVNGSVQRTDTWNAAISANVPTGITLEIEPTVAIINAEDGVLQRFMNHVIATQRPGSGTGAYSAASGACVNWYTAGVRKGRRIRGRSFLVPFAGASLATNGTLDDTKLNTLRTATNTLVTSQTTPGDLGVWARPTTKGATDGVWNVVNSFTIPDKAAILRSRRD
jgi:hypothetical protein